MKGPAWVAHEPSSGPGVFIGGVVIQNATDDFAGWKVPLDPIEEPDELLMAVADHILVDDRALKHIQSGKDCSGKSKSSKTRSFRLRVAVQSPTSRHLGSGWRCAGKIERHRPD